MNDVEPDRQLADTLLDAGRAEVPPAGALKRALERIAAYRVAPRVLGSREMERDLRLVSSSAAMRSDGSRARRWRVTVGVAAVAAVALAAGAGLVLSRGEPPRRGRAHADAHEEVHVGPHVIAVLEQGAELAWEGDDVTQTAGDVFYRVEPGGARRVHTSVADLTVLGTCFDVKVRPAEGGDMTRREAVAGAVGALGSAAVLVGVYEGKVSLSRADAAIDVASGQGARADAQGIHGPERLDAASHAFEASAGDDPWRSANASLADQVSDYRRRLDESQAQTRAIKANLDRLEARLGPRSSDAGSRYDAYPSTPDDWKNWAKVGVVRAKNCCFPGAGWQPSASDLAEVGLAPSDGPALARAVAAASDHMWQATQPACARIVGAEEAARLGNDSCWPIILHDVSKDQWDVDAQLVADIRAGNVPMPPTGQLDDLAKSLLAMSNAMPDFENELTPSFGPEVAHAIAWGHLPWARCAMQLGRGARTGEVPMPPEP